MPLVKFEPAIPPSQRPQNHALVRAATGIGPADYIKIINICDLQTSSEQKENNYNLC